MDKSLLIIEQEFEHGDDSTIAQSLITATLAENGQLERGADLGRKFLENEELDLMERAMLQSNLAFTLFLTVNSIRATVLARQGERERASESLNVARSLDPANRHLPEAEAAIAAIDR